MAVSLKKCCIEATAVAYHKYELFFPEHINYITFSCLPEL